MSAVLIGSIGTMTLGVSALFGKIFSPSVSRKVVVEPAFLYNLELHEKSWLFGKAYKTICLEQQTCFSSYLRELSRPRAFVKSGIIQTVPIERKNEKFVELLLASYPITWEEALAITAALQIRADIVYLTRPVAREVARKLKIETGGIIRFLIDSFRRGSISFIHLRESVADELARWQTIT